MRTLIRFLLRSKTLFFFLFLEIFSLLLIINHNQFQRVHFLNSSNVVVGSVYRLSDKVYQYFNLTEVNESLSKENAYLRSKLSKAESEVSFYKQDTSYTGRKEIALSKNYSFITAKVIQASLIGQHNHITLDKGISDGVDIGMGVINEKGIIGIVSSASQHFSVVLPILNSVSRSHISAKVLNKSQSGALFWEGGDMRYATMDEVPLYVSIEKGDTIMTSGYSSIFPEGIMIGTVDEYSKKNDNFYSIKVLLSVDFNLLSYVSVIDYPFSEEKEELEKKVEEVTND